MSLGRSAGATDPGRKRRHNEDAYVCEPPLFAVADGMGGAQAGEIASKLAAAALRAGPKEDVAALIQEANRLVYERASEDESVSGMGTTVTVALVEDGAVHIGHVGDSRAYLIRDGSLEQLTEDHSLVAELVRSGKLSPEEAEAHPQRSVITRALGTDPEVDVDTFTVQARPGDLFLLCSDGLTSMVDDDAILAIVEENRSDLQRAAKALVDAANRGGGEDNTTVVFFEIAPPLDEHTAPLPAVEGPAEPDRADEDTLSGLDRVPPVETMVVSPERVDEWLSGRPAGRVGDGRGPAPPRPRPSRSAILIGAAALVAVLAGLVVFGLSRAHFVGAEKNGHVAVYQGVPWNLFGSVRLYRVVYESPLLAAQLSQDERKRLFDHDLHSYSSALRAVRAYEQDVVP